MSTTNMISSADIPFATDNSFSKPIGLVISESVTSSSVLETTENKKGSDSAASHRRPMGKRKKSD